MKSLYILLAIIIPFYTAVGQDQNLISGKVVSMVSGTPLPGTTIRSKSTGLATITDAEGRFSLSWNSRSDTLEVLLMGYHTKKIPLSPSVVNPLIIQLKEKIASLGEVVVSTGYYEIPRERATGSFTHIDNELLNRSVSTNIISRLEGITSGLSFDRREEGVIENSLQLRVRGQSTLYANQDPLIVVDNFPYEGDLSSINPNDVQSITVLKDAAAASIWGARAGNGVIVITTKKGKFNQTPRLSFTSNITISDKPDLFYNPGFLIAPEFIPLEQQLFETGFYDAWEEDSRKEALSPVVEILIKQRDGQLSQQEATMLINKLKTYDVREDAARHLYRNAVKQQYAINLSGGSRNIAYYLSGGIDKNMTSTVGNEYRRITLNAANIFRPSDRLRFESRIMYLRDSRETNGIKMTGLRIGGNKAAYPYARLADENGNALPLERDYRISYIKEAQNTGLNDWNYRPLEEIDLGDHINTQDEIRIDIHANFRILQGLDASAYYQFQKIAKEEHIGYGPETYYSRNLVNRFTQEDGTKIFPEGGILYNYGDATKSQSGRGQLTYQNDFNGKGRIAAIAGLELRDVHSMGDSYVLYGYDEGVLTTQMQLDYITRYPLNPWGSGRIPQHTPSLSDLTDRFLSYYANGSYTYMDRYIFSVSARKDASNLFGVNTNQKGVPLWSAGISWNINEEKFYRIPWLSYLKLRTTYGYNGNVDKSVTALTTARYRTDRLTGLPKAEIINPANPELRWEKVSIWNIGVDLETTNGLLSGSLEYFRKKGTDLMGDGLLDPTTGFWRNLRYAYRRNYADIVTKGIDLELNIRPFRGNFSWRTDLIFNYVQDKVTQYHYKNISAISYISVSPPLEGRPRYGIYSLPWAGLDPETGDPLVIVAGEQSKAYSTYLRELEINDLVYHGPALPPFSGAIRNTLSWKGITVSANVTWKAGYYFRRSTISYDQLFNNWRGHADFIKRWQNPGDERNTQVPSIPMLDGTNQQSRDQIYQQSTALVEKGDHIRLRDFTVSYQFAGRYLQATPVKSLRVYLYAANLGILWRANSVDLDPDYPVATVLPPASLALGLQVSF